MINSKLITEPPHYLRGRTIQPIEVIEQYRLGHHLACAVKYIARAGRKNAIVEDFKKAEWYLQRATRVKSRSSLLLSGECVNPIAIDDIVSDWKLSPALGACLTHILSFAEADEVHYSRLSEALAELRLEIEHTKFPDFGELLKENAERIGHFVLQFFKFIIFVLFLNLLFPLIPKELDINIKYLVILFVLMIPFGYFLFGLWSIFVFDIFLTKWLPYRYERLRLRWQK